ncbi:MAG: spermidine synthase [Elusimicrobia bacterium]|nr:MAG: spermidine synthase [Elusimicrobiota bacterium]
MRSKRRLLLASVFVAANCGLVYELLAGALSSYLLGDSITQFSLVIGVFLSAMGLGAWLSKFIERRLLRAFILLEAAVGVVGGFSAVALYAAFTYADVYTPYLFLVGGTVGVLVGAEIPLLIRILKDDGPLKATISDVFAVDYAGALAASLLFPILLVPKLGLMMTGFLFGALNVAVAGVVVWAFRDRLGRVQELYAWCLAAFLLLVGGAVSSQQLVGFFEAERYEDEIIYSKRTPYQQITLTRWRNDVRLFLNGQLQLSTIDEHRYHESLVHPAMSVHGNVQRVLILGGGDGMALREVYKYASVRDAVVVDLDPEMTRLFAENSLLRDLNGGSINDSRTTIVNEDAMNYLRKTQDFFDVIIMDLPDPNDIAVGKLYTKDFFHFASRRLRSNGVLVSQATSPFYAREAFWCIVNTMRASVGTRSVSAYHAYVPSFGEWGFSIATKLPIDPSALSVSVPTRFLNEGTVRGLFAFPKDLGPIATSLNRLDDQVLVRLYEKGWKRFNF